MADNKKAIIPRGSSAKNAVKTLFSCCGIATARRSKRHRQILTQSLNSVIPEEVQFDLESLSSTATGPGGAAVATRGVVPQHSGAGFANANDYHNNPMLAHSSHAYHTPSQLDDFDEDDQLLQQNVRNSHTFVRSPPSPLSVCTTTSPTVTTVTFTHTPPLKPNPWSSPQTSYQPQQGVTNVCFSQFSLPTPSPHPVVPAPQPQLLSTSVAPLPTVSYPAQPHAPLQPQPQSQSQPQPQAQSQYYQFAPPNTLQQQQPWWPSPATTNPPLLPPAPMFANPGQNPTPVPYAPPPSVANPVVPHDPNAPQLSSHMAATQPQPFHQSNGAYSSFYPAQQYPNSQNYPSFPPAQTHPQSFATSQQTAVRPSFPAPALNLPPPHPPPPPPPPIEPPENGTQPPSQPPDGRGPFFAPPVLGAANNGHARHAGANTNAINDNESLTSASSIFSADVSGPRSMTGASGHQNNSTHALAAHRANNNNLNNYIVNLQSFPVDRRMRDEACAICLGMLGEAPVSASARCQHVMHTDCLKLWLERDHNQACPVCRLPFVHPTDNNSDPANASDTEQPQRQLLITRVSSSHPVEAAVEIDSDSDSDSNSIDTERELAGETDRDEEELNRLGGFVAVDSTDPVIVGDAGGGGVESSDRNHGSTGNV